MARPTDKKLRIRHILVNEASVDEDVVKFMMEAEAGPQIECPADLAKLWTEATSTDGPATDILANLTPPIDKAGFKGRRLIGRLLTAWDYAKADHAGHAVALAAPEVPEIEPAFEDGPWPEARKGLCTKAVRDAYGGLSFDLDQVPNDMIMNRLDRMFRDRKTALLQLDKMRHQAEHELIIAAVPKEQELLTTGTTSLFMRSGAKDLPEIPLGSIEQVLHALQVMSNGWVLLGTGTKDSKLKNKPDGTPEQVREWGLTEGMAWPAFCRRMAQGAMKLGDSEGQVVRYLRVRERQTRQLAVKLWSEEAWPWGEAMVKVWQQEMAVLWTVTMQSNAFGFQVSIPGLTDKTFDMNSNKRQRFDDWSHPDASSSNGPPRRERGGRNQQQPQQQQHQGDLPSSQLQAWMLCTAFNSKKGCTHKGRDCPQQKQHRCSFVTASGPCGAKGHGAANCPNRGGNGQQQKGERRSKGKGKGKNKKQQ